MNTFFAATSCHGSQCVEIFNPCERMRKFIHSIMKRNFLDDPAYILRKKAGAFLQCDSQDYMMVEFWSNEYEDFITWMNQEYISFSID